MTRLIAALLLAGLAAAPAFAAPEARYAVSLDPRIELAGVVDLLTGPPRSGAYFAAIERRFGHLRDHPAVRLHAEQARRSFSLSERGHALIRLSAFPGLEPSKAYSIDDLATDGKTEFPRWIDGLRGFGLDSKFMEFHGEQSRLLKADLARFRAAVEAGDYLAKIEAYTGLPFPGRYDFLLTSFDGMESNAVFQLDDGAVRIVSVVALDAFRRDDFPAHIWHETAHGILDEVTELFSEQILASGDSLKSTSIDCRNPRHCVREHIVQAVASRLVKTEQGARAANQGLQQAEEKGLIFVRAVAERLSEYEADRKRYPTLLHFYPRLLDVFSKPPQGPAFTLQKERALFSASVRGDWLRRSAMPYDSAARRRRAVEFLDRILSRSSRPDLHFKRAVLHQLLGHPEQALRDADLALAARPDVGALLVRGLALQARGDESGAAAAFRAAQALSQQAAAPGR